MINAANFFFLWSNSKRNFSIFQEGFNHFQALADEQVYARLYHTIWKGPVPYQNVLLLIDGFYQVRVRQKVISKQQYNSFSQMVNTCCCRGQALLQELLQEIVLRNSATQRGSINKKISINDFRIEKSIYRSYTKPRF